MHFFRDSYDKSHIEMYEFFDFVKSKIRMKPQIKYYMSLLNDQKACFVYKHPYFWLLNPYDEPGLEYITLFSPHIL